MKRLMTSVFFYLVLLCNIVKAEDLPKANFAKIAGLKDTEWSAAGENDGKNYRSVIAGKKGEFTFNNWWGGAIRPPSGEIYVLEIQFQDKIKKPAIVSSFGGVGGDFGPSELHRIGGSGDGKWKTAYIPVSWDLLMLKDGDTLARFYVNNPDKENELPLSDILIRKAVLPADRVRYEAESRAWVKNEFTEFAAKIVVPVKELAIGDKFKDKAMLPFARPYYERVGRFDVPTIKELEGTININASLNEFESGAFGVYAKEDLQGVTYEVSDFTNKDGKLDCTIQLSAVEFATLSKKSKDGTVSSYYSAERLWSAFPEDIKKGETGWYWFTIKTEEGKSKPGIYEGKVTITSGKLKEVLPVRVEILNLKLLTMEEAGLWNGGCITGLTTEQELISMRDHNHNMVNLWIASAAPGMKKGKDKVDLNYYYLDDYMKLCMKYGQKRVVWFLGGNPPAFPHTLTLERSLFSAFYEKPQTDFFQILNAEDKRDKIIPEVRGLYINWVKDIIAHGEEKKWPEQILTPFDEPVKYSKHVIDKGYKYAVGTGLWTREHFKDSCAAIHEASPKTKVYISMHHNFVREPFGRVGETFLPDIDVVNTNAIDEDPDLNRKVLDKGKEFWQYGGTWGGRYNFGFYFGVHESTGSLVWAYNWGARFNCNGKRDDQYAYNSPFGTIVTPEYEMFREAWDDRRYLATYMALAKKKGIDTKEFFANLKKEVLGILGEATVDKVEVFFVKEKDSDKNKLEAIRGRIAQKILDLSK